MKKKYLIVSMDMANLAAGIVFRRLVMAMSEYVDCHIICPRIDESACNSITVLTCPKYNRLPNRLETSLYNLLGYKLTDYIWSNKVYGKLKKTTRKEKYDAVLSFVYGGNDSPLILGKRIADENKLPWGIYSVDAIPAPLSWSKNEKFRCKRISFLNKFISQADAYFASNPIMLEYELSLFASFKGISGYVLTPCDFDYTPCKESKTHTEIVFLYAGDLYGPRRVSSLLKGFELFSQSNKGSKLVFVGNNAPSHFNGFEHLLESGQVERHGFTKNIKDFYDRADVLIDLNADIENDVFLSSKVCNYLSYNKPIIAISEEGSPVRALMGGIVSIIHSHHNPEEICEALEQSSLMVGNPVSDREKLKNKFMPQEVAKHFCSDLEKVINIRQRREENDGR